MRYTFLTEAEQEVAELYAHANRVVAPMLASGLLACELKNASAGVVTAMMVFALLLLLTRTLGKRPYIRDVERRMGWWRRQFYPLKRGWLFFLALYTTGLFASGVLTPASLNALPSLAQIFVH